MSDNPNPNPETPAPEVEPGSPPSPGSPPASPSGGQGGEGVPTQSPSPPPSWGGPSEQEWRTMVAGMQHMAQQLGLVPGSDPDPPDFDEMGPLELIDHAMSQRFEAIAPYLQAAAKDAGEKRMNEFFDEVERDPAIGKFDRKLAERIASGLFHEIGDPLESLRQGAQMAAEMKRTWSKEAVEEYKASLKRTPYEDPGVSGSGEHASGTLKTYDEVIEKWAGQEDV